MNIPEDHQDHIPHSFLSFLFSFLITYLPTYPLSFFLYFFPSFFLYFFISLLFLSFILVEFLPAQLTPHFLQWNYSLSLYREKEERGKHCKRWIPLCKVQKAIKIKWFFFLQIIIFLMPLEQHCGFTFFNWGFLLPILVDITYH